MVEDGFKAGDCSKAYLAPLNDDLIRQWNCFSPANLKYAGDIPNVDWDNRTIPYLQTEFYWVLRNNIEKLLYNSNIGTFTLPGALPRFYFYRGYSTLVDTMANQNNFAHGDCGITMTSISTEAITAYELANTVAVLPYHPDMYDEGALLWNINTTIDQTMLVYGERSEFPFAAEAGPNVPFYDYVNGGVIVYKFASTTSSWGVKVSTAILQNLFQAVGIPYTKYATNNVLSGEAGLYPIGLTPMTQFARKTLSTFVYKTVNMDLNIAPVGHYKLANPIVANSMNVQAFKYYWNVNNPINLISDPQTDELTLDTQSKLLTETPLDSFTGVTCESISNACTEYHPIDVIFAMDGSEMLTSSQFYTELTFAIDIANHLPLGKGTVRIGVVSYSSVVDSFELYPFNNFTEAQDKIGKMKKPGGHPKISSGLNAVTNIFGNSQSGVRGKGVPKVVILVTAVYAHDDAAKEAIDALHQLGVNVAVVAVGNAYTDSQLDYYATNPSSGNRRRNKWTTTVENTVVKVGSYNLESILTKILTETCKLAAKIGNDETPVVSTTYTDTTINFEYLTKEVPYSLVVETDGTVVVYMNYYPETAIPTEFDYDVAYQCTNSCVIAIPALPFVWSARREAPVITAGSYVVLAMKFGSPSARREEIVEVGFTITPVLYDAATLSVPMTNEKAIIPPTILEMELAALAYEQDNSDSGDQDDQNDDSTVPVLVIAASAAGVAALMAGVIVAVAKVKRTPVAENTAVVNTVVSVESSERNEHRPAVKRLNSSRCLNELTK
jgi:hypothetical protein